MMQLCFTDAQAGCVSLKPTPDSLVLRPSAEIRMVVMGGEWGVDPAGEASEGSVVETIRFAAGREALAQHIEFLCSVRDELDRIAAALESGGIRTRPDGEARTEDET